MSNRIALCQKSDNSDSKLRVPGAIRQRGCNPIPSAINPRRHAVRCQVLRIRREYQLESQHIRILQIAAEAWDSYEEARDSSR